jgi:hypothetical protein
VPDAHRLLESGQTEPHDRADRPLRQKSGDPDPTVIRNFPGFPPWLIALPSRSVRPWAGLDPCRSRADVFAGVPGVTTNEGSLIEFLSLASVFTLRLGMRVTVKSAGS